MTTEEDIATIKRLRAASAAILTGHPPAVQGAVLADLLATWLGGFISRDGPSRTHELREALLQDHLETVRALIPINAARIHGDPGNDD